MKQHLRPIMFVGTCSDAGKSVINAAFCRIFKQDGYQPAPFKAQNMSLNSYSTPEGGEMGRAQVVQAEACGISPHTDMNPILLKPTNDKSSQVVLNGKPVGNMSAKDYFGIQNQKEELFKEAIEAFKRLEARYNPIVLEGAGSISELNLRDRDITNMRMAIAAGASTYLVADIDRGGVFGSVYGTIALLRPEERVLMKGVIINKFRGDASLFEEGRRLLKELTGIPVVGVIPWFRDIKIEEEDSVALDMKNNTYKDGKINVAIILLKRMSNFTDFDVLEMDPRFNPYYTNNIDEIEKADSSIYNMLLQVLDEGRLTASNGKTANFKNTVIILTSNVGSRQLKDFRNSIGFASRQASAESENAHSRDIIQKALNKTFAPEFLNRLDEIITFNQLDQSAIEQIAQLEIDRLAQRIKESGFTMQTDADVVKHIATQGYDMQYGARPLRRAIQSKIEDKLVDLIIEQSLQPGCTIYIGMSADGKDTELSVKA